MKYLIIILLSPFQCLLNKVGPFLTHCYSVESFIDLLSIAPYFFHIHLTLNNYGPGKLLIQPMS